MRVEVPIAGIQPTLFGLWSAFDSAGEVVASVAFAGALHGSQRANIDGAVGIQPVISVVRWLNMDEAVWVPTVFTKNRDRLLEGDIATVSAGG